METQVVSNGTTILGLECQGGIVLAADSRATTGAYIAMRDIRKIMKISSKIYVCQSGSAADTQFLIKYARYFQNVLAIDSEGMKLPSVGTTAQVLHKLIQANKGRLLAQLICGGFDETGPSLYMIMQSGMVAKRQFAAGGSGSTYITSYCDHNFKPNMTMEEATEFAVKAVTLATIRDGNSGGPINILKITQEGAESVWFKPSQQPFNASIVKS